jgi:DNA-binding NtrC family response regulator
VTSKLRRRCRVFVIDHEQILAEVLAEFLRKNGLEARSFEQPKEALDASRFSPPDLLVANVEILPLMAFDLAVRVREYAPGCKVLLFATHAGTNSLLESVRRARNDFILLFSPVRLSELLEQIYRTIEDA